MKMTTFPAQLAELAKSAGVIAKTARDAHGSDIRSLEANIVMAQVQKRQTRQPMKLIANLRHLEPAVTKPLLPECFSLRDNVAVEAEPFQFFIS